ncbi:hypothetical protein [Rhodococcus triatomae]
MTVAAADRGVPRVAGYGYGANVLETGAVYLLPGAAIGVVASACSELPTVRAIEFRLVAIPVSSSALISTLLVALTVPGTGVPRESAFVIAFAVGAGVAGLALLLTVIASTGTRPQEADILVS